DLDADGAARDGLSVVRARDGHLGRDGLSGAEALELGGRGDRRAGEGAAEEVGAVEGALVGFQWEEVIADLPTDGAGGARRGVIVAVGSDGHPVAGELVRLGGWKEDQSSERPACAHLPDPDRVI